MAAITPIVSRAAFPIAPTGTPPAQQDFGSILGNAINQLNGLQQTANNQLQQYAQGNGNLVSVVTATAKANLGLEVATQVRNDVVQAYQSLMNMQI